MNYLKIYNQIIERAKNRSLTGCKERHHIIPKCMGGGNSEANMAVLTPKEHYVCHLLLYRANPSNQKLAYAFWMMCNCPGINKNRPKASSRLYAEMREFHKNYQSESKKGNCWNKGNSWNRGKTQSLESNKRRSAKLKGRPGIKGRQAWNKGVSKTEDERLHLSNISNKKRLCVVDTIKYASITEASKILNIPTSTIYSRAINPNFKNYRLL
jgi:hypothetical protein